MSNKSIKFLLLNSNLEFTSFASSVFHITMDTLFNTKHLFSDYILSVLTGIDIVYCQHCVKLLLAKAAICQRTFS